MRTTLRRADLPRRRVSLPAVIVLTIALSALSTAASSSDLRVSTVAATPRMLQVDPDWDLLLPPNRGAERPEPPAPIHNYLGEDAPAATQRGSAAVNPILDGRMVRIPGFIVPLDEDSEGRVTDFFLVPYVGACIHVPPPRNPENVSKARALVERAAPATPARAVVHQPGARALGKRVFRARA